ncbi:arabinosyltransferase domain-containing protein [Corynebacterium cystitidis]|uniref:Arabinosyltransferase C n=1 Tax=Corynebacterium cystitidis DSM 20524 TaxID=1121357 RepID=A0A1H9U4R8_9CORY|nr:putative arabinosyltransferase C [Corynebacterium cystitidis DSM 20524]SES04241.1 arabinosyltransferase C [Corynebacterium cystitidis DSM 20524]SNV89691.1 arabinosyl transferase C [Corynebacterium cystitidis]
MNDVQTVEIGDTGSTATAAGSTYQSASSGLKKTAIVTGLLAFLLFVLTPFLPVNQTQSSLSWPQDGTLESVNAPLISMAPENLEITVPVAAFDAVRDGQSTVVGTLPDGSEEAYDRGLFVTATEGGGASVSSLNKVVFELSPEEFGALNNDAVVEISASEEGVTVSVPGTSHKENTDEDLRPQVTGIYTEIDGDAQALIDAGLSADVEINSRFTSTPTTLKFLAMAGGILLTIVALVCLWRMDQADGRRFPLFNSTWRTVKPLDGIVVFVLGFWHIFGANTSDDGFILTMARVANDSGYMANYYRWYGVPESPFGSPFYDLLSLLATVSTASVWMRLPTLIAGILIWLLLSREILPRLGDIVAKRRMAYWTAAFMFLAFWLPYNNGVRPEPMVALGVIVTWALFERSIATGRLFPAALGTMAAAWTLTVGPTGLMAVGVFLISLPHLFRIMRARLMYAPWITYIAPFLAAGTTVLVPVFADQTLATVLESTRVRSEVGPALEWYSEWVRYSTLFQQSVDGSLTRRFAMFTMLFCLILVVWSFSRFGAVPGAAKGPTLRMLLIVALSMFFLMFTPTKWTHHFGIYASIAGAVAALGAVVLSHIAIKSVRARTLSIAAVLFLLAITLAGWNAWWYVSSFNIPWWDRPVQFKGIEAANVMLIIALIVLGIGLWQSFKHSYQRGKALEAGTVEQFDAAQRTAGGKFSGIMSAPIAVASIGIVVFSMLSFTKSFIDQAPAYSVGMGNVRTFAGEKCALAVDAMLETNTNDAFLTPVDGVPLGRSLESGKIRGFHPRGVPEFIEPKNMNSASVGAIGDSSQTTSGNANTGSRTTTGTTSDRGSDSAVPETTNNTESTTQEAISEQSTSTGKTQGNRGEEETGINGSTVNLPFNLDYTRIPVVGSWEEEPRGTAELESSWYELPAASDTAPLLVISVAGKIEHKDINGISEEGEELVVEYGSRNDDGTYEVLGEIEMLDSGPTPSWRNLRYPLKDVPEEAEVVRIVASDTSLASEDWIAVTPPRVPELKSMNEIIDSDTPGLIDWSTALQFPCQRTFNHYAGVTEIPEFRISPDAPGKAELSGFMDFLGGGSLGTAEAVNYSYEVPGYLRNDWQRDWGSVAKYELRTNSIGEEPKLATIDHEEIIRHGLWHPSDMKIRDLE